MNRKPTQPEEIAQILIAMAAHDSEADSPLYGGERLSESILDAGGDSALTDPAPGVGPILPDPQTDIGSEQ